MPTPDPKTRGNGLPKMTNKQIAFCNLYVKNRCSGAEAYRQAFDAQKWTQKALGGAVNKLFKNVHVIKYIEDLRAEVRKDARISLVDHLDVLQDIRDQAINEKKYAAAVTAETNRGRASGLYVDRIEVAKHKPALVIKRANGKRTNS